jgi:acyl dehydratase
VTTYFEDLTAGRAIELGSTSVTADDIIEFATKYDPQPFHVDPVAAAESPYGGLIASGWHTCALFMRLLYDGMIHDSSSQGSPGMEDLRWLAPVRPGDRLSASFVVEDATPSATKPMRGTVLFRCEMTNQHDQIVLRMRGRGLYGKRPGDGVQSDERL